MTIAGMDLMLIACAGANAAFAVLMLDQGVAPMAGVNVGAAVICGLIALWKPQEA